MSINIKLSVTVTSDIYNRADKEVARCTDVQWSIPVVPLIHKKDSKNIVLRQHGNMFQCKDYINDTLSCYITSGAKGANAYTYRQEGNLPNDGYSYILFRSTRYKQIIAGIKKLINPVEKAAGLFETEAHPTELGNVFLLKMDGCYFKVLPIMNMMAMLIRMQFYNHIVTGDTLEEYVNNYVPSLEEATIGGNDRGYIWKMLEVVHSNVFNVLLNNAKQLVIPDKTYITLLKKTTGVHSVAGIKNLIIHIKQDVSSVKGIQTEKTREILIKNIPWIVKCSVNTTATKNPLEAIGVIDNGM